MIKAEQEQVERVREKIAERIFNWYKGYRDIRQGEWEKEYDSFKETFYERADELLSVEGIEIKHPDQSRPYNPYDYAENPNMLDGRTANFHQQRSQGFIRCKKDMSDFVRVIDKEAHNEPY